MGDLEFDDLLNDGDRDDSGDGGTGNGYDDGNWCYSSYIARY